MARFRLEDLEGGVNVTCFPRTYEQYRHLLRDDAVVVCRAKLEERLEDEATISIALLLEEVMDLENALIRFSGGLVIHLSHQDQSKVPDLLTLVEQNRGKNRLFLEIEGSDGHRRRIRAGERHTVQISATLAQEIDRLLGRGRARLARV
jgi:DNA polymerase-3 subunit alpha